MKADKTLITTHTGEPSQPVRIYYHVVKPKTVERIFEKLRCVYFETPFRRWRWIYEYEAQKLRFERSYSKIDKEVKPVVIGEFFWRGDSELLLEVRSFDRAIKALEFFAKRINPRVAQAKKLRVVNRFFAAQEPKIEQLLKSPYDRFFDGDEVEFQLNQQQLQVEQFHNLEQENPEALFESLEAKMKQKIPEIEEIPLDYNQEKELNWSRLQMTLIFRQIEAQHRFAGNEKFSQYEIVQELSEIFGAIIQKKQKAQLQKNEQE